MRRPASPPAHPDFRPPPHRRDPLGRAVCARLWVRRPFVRPWPSSRTIILAKCTGPRRRPKWVTHHNPRPIIVAFCIYNFIYSATNCFVETTTTNPSEGAERQKLFYGRLWRALLNVQRRMTRPLGGDGKLLYYIEIIGILFLWKSSTPSPSLIFPRKEIKGMR